MRLHHPQRTRFRLQSKVVNVEGYCISYLHMDFVWIHRFYSQESNNVLHTVFYKNLLDFRTFVGENLCVPGIYLGSIKIDFLEKKNTHFGFTMYTYYTPLLLLMPWPCNPSHLIMPCHVQAKSICSSNGSGAHQHTHMPAGLIMNVSVGMVAFRGRGVRVRGHVLVSMAVSQGRGCVSISMSVSHPRGGRSTSL